MPLGLFLNPNFTAEEAMKIHLEQQARWAQRISDNDRDLTERLAEAEETAAAEIFMAIVQDLENRDRNGTMEKFARRHRDTHLRSIQEAYASIQTINLMFMWI